MLRNAFGLGDVRPGIYAVMLQIQNGAVGNSANAANSVKLPHLPTAS